MLGRIFYCSLSCHTTSPVTAGPGFLGHRLWGGWPLDLSEPNNLYSSSYTLYIPTSLLWLPSKNVEIILTHFRKFSDLYNRKLESSAFYVFMHLLSTLLICWITSLWSCKQSENYEWAVSDIQLKRASTFICSKLKKLSPACWSTL